MNKLKILVVEDDLITMDIITSTLEKEFDVKVASNGSIGYKVYKTFSPEIIITDLNMPSYNGLEMIKKIRQIDKKTKIIVYTSHQDIEYLLKATELNLTKYLVKPFNKEDLFEALEIAVEDINNYEFIPKKIIEFKDNFNWDISKKILIHNGKEVKLTPKEKKVLDLLISSINIIVSFDDIIYYVWENEKNRDKNTLKTLISGLKKKLPKDLIENIYGEGYKISKY